MLSFCRCLTFLFTALSVKAGQLMHDINPDLREFQDKTECFPVVETWHQIYRDFEEDPYFGGKAKCVTGTETGDYEDGSAIVVFDFPPDEVLAQWERFAFYVVLEMAMTIIVPAYTVTKSTDKFNHKGTGCSIWYTHKELHIYYPFCDFIFELLCGFKPTYQIYDDSCVPNKMKPKYGVETEEYALLSKEPNMLPGRSVIVHLFEWRYDDIAEECETFLGPRGYGAVQISPVHEHGIILDDVVKRPWYERYQPVSYKINTRSGNETAFQDMVRRCNSAGVRIYVDVVPNHMTGSLRLQVGTAGSTFSYNDRSYPGVPYNSSHFHGKGRCHSSSGNIENYLDTREVRNCKLVGLLDLDQGHNYVRDKITQSMNRLIQYGVAGFRIDAAKHVCPDDLEAIYGKLNDLNTDFFPRNSRPFIYQEVIDMNNGEPITRWQYRHMGRVTEFLYGSKLGAVVRKSGGELLAYLRQFGEAWGFLPSNEALVFIDNHDNQRGHGGAGSVLTFFEPRLYKIATAFMLAWPYGVPRVMSSYRWPRDFRDGKDQNDWIGPPADSEWRIQNVLRHPDDTCGNGWVCEHRWRQIYNLVELRNAAGNAPVTNWWDNGYQAISFGRGNDTFIVINNENFILEHVFQTFLPTGTYCDVISGSKTSTGCSGRSFYVNEAGKVAIKVDNAWEDPMVALHTRAKLS